MRRRKFEIRAHAGITKSGHPRAFYGVFDKTTLLDRFFGVPQHSLYDGDSPADCHQWIQRYRQAEKDVAAFRGAA